MRFLISRGADVNVRTEKMHNENTTPLHDAAENGNVRGIELLLDAGADIRAVAYDGATPLHAAVGSGDIRSVSLLLSRGADPNAKDNKGRSPLLYSLGRKYLAPVVFLLQLFGARMGNGNISSQPPQKKVMRKKSVVV